MLKVRRFKYSNNKCQRKIFSERYDGYTKPYSRKTDRATDCLSSMLLEVSSSKESYLSELIQMKQSASTCHRMISSLPIPVYGDKTIIGIVNSACSRRSSLNSKRLPSVCFMICLIVIQFFTSIYASPLKQ